MRDLALQPRGFLEEAMILEETLTEKVKGSERAKEKNLEKEKAKVVD